MLPELHWLRPEMAWLILPLTLVWLLFWRFRQWPSQWQEWISPHLQAQVLSGQDNKTPKRSLWLLAFMLLGVLALCGPSVQKMPQPVFQLKKATVLIVDMSHSMYATDLTPNRATQARFKALDYLDGLSEGEVALISFAGDAFIISPLTQDKNNVRLLLPTLNPDLMPVQGSNVDAALTLAQQLLQQGGYPVGDIVLFTDGFASQEYPALRQSIDKLPHRLSILAFGSAEGAPVQLASGELLKDKQGAIVIPKVPLTQLKQLSELTGGAFAVAGPTDADLQKLWQLPELGSEEKPKQSTLSGEQWQDNAVYVVWLLLLIWLWQKKQGQLLAVLLCLYLPTSHSFDWESLYKSRQQQAKDAYQQKEYAKAQEHFSDPLWQGNAAYRNGDYAAAEHAYRQAKGPDARYNLGNSLAMQQRYEEAIDAYQDALEQQPDFEKASKNLELVKQALEEQAQENQQQEEKNQQKSSQKPSGDADKSDSNEAGQKENQEQDSQSQQEQGSEDADASNAQAESSAEKDSEPSPSQQQTSEPQHKQPSPLQSEEPLKEGNSEQEQQTQKAISEAWPNASPEQSQQLDNLLRKVQDDPALLLKRKMALEYQKRRFERAPAGVIEEW